MSRLIGAHLLMWLVLLCLVAGPGCTQQQKKPKLQAGSVSLGDRFNEAALVLGTNRLLAECYVNMVTASAEAARLTEQYSVREGSIRWRILTASRLDRIRAMNDPRIRFAALWTLAAQMRIGFTEGEDKTRFGDQTYRYQDFARAFEKSVVQLGYDVFPDAAIDQVRPEIEGLAKGVGVAGWFTPKGTTRQPQDPLTAIISVPLSPISGLEGVGNTPDAINRFTDTAREMTRVVENLPERTRWQVELMLLEAENSGAIATMLRELESTRKSIEAATTRFPDQARSLLADPKLAENLDRVQQSLKSAGEVAQQFTVASSEFRQAVADVRQSLKETQDASAAVVRASQDVRLTTEVIRGPEKERAATRTAEEERDKFRATDVAAAAERVQQAAAEIRQVIADMRQQGPVPALDAGAKQADRFVRLITWSAAILIGIAFLAGLALIFMWRLLIVRGRRPGPAA